MSYKALPFALVDRSRALLDFPHPVPKPVPRDFAHHLQIDREKAALFSKLRMNVCDMPRSGSSSLDRFVSYAQEWFGEALKDRREEKKTVPARLDYFFTSWTTVHEGLNAKRTVSVTCTRWESVCLATAVAALTLHVHSAELFGGNARDDVLKAAKRAAALARHAEEVSEAWENAPRREDFFETSPAFLRGLRGLCEGLWWFASVARHRPGNDSRANMDPKEYASAMLAIHDATYPDHEADFVRKCRQLPEIGESLSSALRHVAQAALFEHHSVLSQYYDPVVETVPSSEASWEAAYYHQNEVFNILDEVVEFAPTVEVCTAFEEVKTRLCALEMTCKAQKGRATVYAPKAVSLDRLPGAFLRDVL